MSSKVKIATVVLFILAVSILFIGFLWFGRRTHGEVAGIVSENTSSSSSPEEKGIISPLGETHVPASQSEIPNDLLALQPTNEKMIGPVLVPSPLSQIPRPQKEPSPTPRIKGTPLPKPSVDPYLISLPDGFKEVPERLPVSKGEISFTFKADWGEADRELVWGNYNGRDIKNLFQIVGSGNILVSDIYDAEANVTNGECNMFFENTTDGREYKVKIEWDYESNPMIQRVYMDGELKRECPSNLKPTDTGGKIYTGDISNFSVQ